MPSLLKHLAVFAGSASLVLPQQIATDSGFSGPSLEVVHLYNDLYPQCTSALSPLFGVVLGLITLR